MADSKLTALTENTTPAKTDILYIVDNPAVTALSQKITVASLFASIITIQAAAPVTGDANGLYIAPVADGESRFYNKVTLGVYNLTDGGYTAF